MSGKNSPATSVEAEILIPFTTFPTLRRQEVPLLAASLFDRGDYHPINFRGVLMIRTRLSLVIFISLLGTLILSAQQGAPKVLRVNAPSAVEKRPEPISVDLEQNAGVRKVVLRYRSFGETSFKGMEMLMAGRTATATLPAEIVLPPYVEYYLELQSDAKVETYPVEGPEANPLQFEVRPANPKDAEIRFLSPEPGETVAAEDLVIAISFYYASDAVNQKATAIFIDGINVTSEAVWSEDVLVYAPQNFKRKMNLGAHLIRVELRDTTGKPYHVIENSFSLSTASSIAEVQARLQSTGTANLEYRNENLSAGATTYIRGDARVDNTYHSVGFGANLHLDNQESENLQPQNRYSLYGQTDFLRIQVGDAFPRFPSLIVSGKRVRGVTGNLALGFFNLDVSYGQIERKIEGGVDSTHLYPSLSDAGGRPFESVRDTSDLTFRFIRRPWAYTRNMLAVRPSFGTGENFQLGFTYMKATDDTNSVRNAVQPQENFIVGTDLLIAFDDQRIKLETQASLALNNTNISGGNFTDAQFDSLAKNRGSDIREDLPINIGTVQKLITVNSSLFPTNPVDVKTLPGVSAEATLSLNYFGNYLRAQFFRRGAGYRSFANEFLQTDIQGFQVSDYLRLHSNKIFLSFSYEGKSDNTAFTKAGTTSYNNLNTSVTLALGASIPTIQIGYGIFGRKSDQSILSPDSASVSKAADEATKRIFFGANYDFVAGIRHSIMASVSFADKKDNTFYKRNQANTFFQTALTSRFAIPLQTTLGVVYSANANDQQVFATTGQDSVLSTQTFNYTVVTVAAQYRMMDDNLRLNAAISPQFGAFTRTSVTASADYSFGMHNLALQFDYIKNSGALGNDTILSFIYRFMF